MLPDSLFFKTLEIQGSPYSTAPQYIKEYIKSLKTGTDNFPQIIHSFQPRPSPKSFCTKFLQPTDKYYHCQQCSIDRTTDQMIQCVSCFDPKLHEGHKLQERTAQSFICSCDCGRKTRLKQSIFCKAHSTTNQQIIQIKQQEARNFDQYFTGFFKIWAFLLNNNQQKAYLFLEAIIKCLCKLCEQSLFYTKLIIQLLQQEIKIKEVTTKLKNKSLEHPQFCNLLRHLLGDEQFLLSFGEYFMNKQAQGQLILFYFNAVRQQLLDSELFLLKMAKKNIYFSDVLDNYLEIAKSKSEQQKNTIISQLLQNLSTKVQKQQYIDKICKIMNNQQFITLKTQKFFNYTLARVLSFYRKTNQNTQKQTQIKNEQKYTLKKSLHIINTIIYAKCNDNILLLDQTLDKLNEQKQFKQNLESFIQIILSIDITGLMKQNYQKIFIFVLFCLQRHPKKLDFIYKFWREVIEEQKAFNDNLDKIYKVVAFVANSYRSFPILSINKENEKNSQNIKQELFKSFLYENKVISKKQLWNDHTKGWLKFQTCGKILKQLCQYNNGNETFVYKSTKNYPNNLLKIPLQMSRNWENVKNIQINYDSGNFGEQPILKKMFLGLFKTPEFYNILQDSFMKALQVIERQPRTLERWKQKGISDNYIILLLLIHKLCHGEEFIGIKQELQKIKLNTDEYRFRFTQIGSQQKIKKLLCILDQSQEMGIPQQGQQSPKKQQTAEEKLKNQQLMKKSLSKKQKIEQKLKQKRKNMLQKMKKQKSSVHEQEEQQNLCLSCKQRQQKDNQFVVLIHISKGNTISKILHAEQSKTSIKISTNLHILHVKCFKQIKKKNMEFQCPLCKQNINSFFPYKPNRAAKSTLNICWNVFNAVLVNNFNIYETGSLFSNLLDALVQSLGFTQLISAKKTKSIIKFKSKVDVYLLNFLQCLYSFSTKEQKQQYKQIYNKLRQTIKTCTKKQLQLFQLLILQAIFFRISGEIDIDPTIIEQLSKYMIEEESKVLKNTLDFITNGNSDYLSSLDQISMEKITEQYIAQNQQKTENMPTSLQHIPSIEQTKTQEQPIIQKNQSEKLQPKQRALQRRSLGISILNPPMKITELFTKSYLEKISKPAKCCGCESNDQISSVCLICRRLFCQKCQQDQIHSQIHLDNFISIDVQYGKLSVTKNGKTATQDIYYNDFMIQYKKGRKVEVDSEDDDFLQPTISKNKVNKNKQLNDQGFVLNTIKFNEIVEKFYNLN